MELNIIMKALEKAEQKHKEQEEFWNLFNDIWSNESQQTEIIEADDNDYCLQSDVDDFIIDKIAKALKECNNNRTYAAARLGIKRETLLAKMKKYVIL
jgi:DNA-binding NtrC family response regulator